MRKRINTDTLVENEAYIVEETVSIGMESYMASSEIAQNYYYGRNGFRRNYTKAVEMFEKLTSSNSHESSLLGICYFKGLGTKQDYEKALELFQSSSRTDLSKFMLAVMEYYGIVLQKNTASAIKKFKGKGLANRRIISYESPSQGVLWKPHHKGVGYRCKLQGRHDVARGSIFDGKSACQDDHWTDLS